MSVDNGVLTFARSNLVLFDGLVSGAGPWCRPGTGTTALTASNSYTGGTSILSGTLQIGNGGTSGSILGDVANGSLLIFDRSDTLVHGGVISGAGSVVQAGAGVTILTGANTYAGGTSIIAGTLQIGDGGTAGSIAGDVANNGALVFDRADDVAFAGTISGAGTLEQAGLGTLTLSANQRPQRQDDHLRGDPGGLYGRQYRLGTGAADAGRRPPPDHRRYRQPAAAQARASRRHDRQRGLCQPVFRPRKRARGTAPGRRRYR
jgi:autotransporter-associated beta strand protein